jgi:hypothetical protein
LQGVEKVNGAAEAAKEKRNVAPEKRDARLLLRAAAHKVARHAPKGVRQKLLRWPRTCGVSALRNVRPFQLADLGDGRQKAFHRSGRL